MSKSTWILSSYIPCPIWVACKQPAGILGTTGIGLSFEWYVPQWLLSWLYWDQNIHLVTESGGLDKTRLKDVYWVASHTGKSSKPQALSGHWMIQTPPQEPKKDEMPVPSRAQYNGWMQYGSTVRRVHLWSENWGSAETTIGWHWLCFEEGIQNSAGNGDHNPDHPQNPTSMQSRRGLHNCGVGVVPITNNSLCPQMHLLSPSGRSDVTADAPNDSCCRASLKCQYTKESHTCMYIHIHALSGIARM